MWYRFYIGQINHKSILVLKNWETPSSGSFHSLFFRENFKSLIGTSVIPCLYVLDLIFTFSSPRASACVFKSAPALSNQDAFSKAYWFWCFASRIFWAAETRHTLCSTGYLKSRHWGPKQWARLCEHFWKTQPFHMNWKAGFLFLWVKEEGQKVPGAFWFSECVPVLWAAATH